MHNLLLLLPVLALALFLILPWQVALILYVPLFLGSAFAYGKAWKALQKPPTTGDAAMIGETAVVLQSDDGHLEVRYQGEIWQAVSNVPVQPGQEVVIRRVDGLILHVTSASDLAEISKSEDRVWRQV